MSTSSLPSTALPCDSSVSDNPHHKESARAHNDKDTFKGSATATTTTTTTSASEMESNDPFVMLHLPQPLLLGSASFTRKLILTEMGIKYHILVRPIDEKSTGDRSNDAAQELVLTIAHAKMQHLLREIQAGRCDSDLASISQEFQTSHGHHSEALRSRPQGWVVLTGDQVVTCNERILEKPESVEDAKVIVANYVIHPPSTVGACVVAHWPTGVTVAGVDTATVHFNPSLPDDLIDRLLQDSADVMSCAGGLMVEHPLVQEHVDRIDGTQDSVMGLSKDLVMRLLQELADKLLKDHVEFS